MCGDILRQVTASQVLLVNHNRVYNLMSVIVVYNLILETLKYRSLKRKEASWAVRSVPQVKTL